MTRQHDASVHTLPPWMAHLAGRIDGKLSETALPDILEQRGWVATDTAGRLDDLAWQRVRRSHLLRCLAIARAGVTVDQWNVTRSLDVAERLVRQGGSERELVHTVQSVHQVVGLVHDAAREVDVSYGAAVRIAAAAVWTALAVGNSAKTDGADIRWPTPRTQPLPRRSLPRSTKRRRGRRSRTGSSATSRNTLSDPEERT